MAKFQKKQPNDSATQLTGVAEQPSVLVSVPNPEAAPDLPSSPDVPIAVSPQGIVSVRFVTAVTAGNLGPRAMIATSMVDSLTEDEAGVTLKKDSYTFFIPMSNVQSIQYGKAAP